MNSNPDTIYTKSMYANLSMLHDREKSHHGYEREPDNAIKALVDTQHNHVVASVLSGEKIPSQTFTEVLYAHLHNGNLQEVLRILHEHPNQDHNFDLEEYIAKLTQGKCTDQDILSCAKYISLITESSYFTRRLLEGLWANRQFALANSVMEQFLSPEEEKLYRIVHNLHQEKLPTADDVSKTIEQVCSIPAEDAERNWDYERKLKGMVGFLIRELDKANVSIPVLESAVVAYEKQKEAGKVWYLSDRHEIDQRIRRHHYKKGEFQEAKDFMESIGDKGCHRDELLMAKLDYAIQTKNEESHRGALQEYITARDTEIEGLGDIFQDDKTDSCAWQKRFDAAKGNARKNCESAIFEFLHGDQSKAREYSDKMIQEAESIVQISAEYEEGKEEHKLKRDREHAKKRVFKRFKKELKSRFLSAGLLHLLPHENGWSDTMKSPEQRQSDRELWLQKGGRRRKFKEREKRDEDPYLMREKDDSHLLKLFLDDGNIEDAIKMIEEDADWRTDQAHWERAMMILDHSPDTFQRLLHILTKRQFGRGYHYADYFDYDSLSQFFVKAHSLGVATDADWNSLIDNLHKYRFSPDHGAMPIPHPEHFVEKLVAIGDIEKAWDFFEKIRKIEAEFRTGMKPETLSKCLSCFINATTNWERRSGSTLAFAGADLEDEVALPEMEQIRYWNLRGEMSADGRNAEQYQASSEELLSHLQDAHSVRILLAELDLGSIRSDEEKERLLMQIYSQNSDAKTRYKIINALLQYDLWGDKKFPEIHNLSSSSPILLYFIRKSLRRVEFKGSTMDLRYFLRKENLPYTERLFTQYQGEFPDVLQRLEKTEIFFEGDIFCKPLARENRYWDERENLSKLWPLEQTSDSEEIFDGIVSFCIQVEQLKEKHKKRNEQLRWRRREEGKELARTDARRSLFGKADALISRVSSFAGQHADGINLTPLIDSLHQIKASLFLEEHIHLGSVSDSSGGEVETSAFLRGTNEQTRIAIMATSVLVASGAHSLSGINLPSLEKIPLPKQGLSLGNLPLQAIDQYHGILTQNIQRVIPVIEAEVLRQRQRIRGCMPIGGKVHVRAEVGQKAIEFMQNVFGLNSTPFAMIHAGESLLLPPSPTSYEIALFIEMLRGFGSVQDADYQSAMAGRLTPENAPLVGAARLLGTMQGKHYLKTNLSTTHDDKTGARIMAYDDGVKQSGMPFDIPEATGRTDVLGGSSVYDYGIHQHVGTLIIHSQFGERFAQLGEYFNTCFLGILQKYGLVGALYQSAWVFNHAQGKDWDTPENHYRMLRRLTDEWMRSNDRPDKGVLWDMHELFRETHRRMGIIQQATISDNDPELLKLMEY